MTEQLENDQSYKPYKNLGCSCGCGKHCGHSCMTDDCDCTECACSECKSKYVIGGKILGNNDLY